MCCSCHSASLRTSSNSGGSGEPSCSARLVGVILSIRSTRSGRGSSGEHASVEVSGDDVEADASEPERRLLLASRLRDDHDRRLLVEERPGPGRIAAAEADVDAAARGGRPRTRPGRARRAPGRRSLWSASTLLERERLQLPLERLVERRPLLCVENRVVGEVRGCLGLVRRDDADELLLAHRLQRVVVEPLDADRGDGVRAEMLAAQRAGAVGGVDERLVGQREELLVQRVVQQPAELLRAPAERRAEVGSPDVADEQRVARQHGVRRRRVALRVVDEDRDRLRGMPRCLPHLETHPPEGRRRRRRAIGSKSYSAWARAPRWTLAPTRSRSSRWPAMKSAWKWVRNTSRIVQPSAAASSTYWSTSRCGSTTAAMPLSSSATRYEA